MICILFGIPDLQPDTLATTLDWSVVWLKEAFCSRERRIGVAPCCPVTQPCAWHEAISRLGQVDATRIETRDAG